GYDEARCLASRGWFQGIAPVRLSVFPYSVELPIVLSFREDQLGKYCQFDKLDETALNGYPKPQVGTLEVGVAAQALAVSGSTGSGGSESSHISMYHLRALSSCPCTVSFFSGSCRANSCNFATWSGCGIAPIW